MLDLAGLEDVGAERRNRNGRFLQRFLAAPGRDDDLRIVVGAFGHHILRKRRRGNRSELQGDDARLNEKARGTTD